ncbi:MAG: site-2 protease family protein, partial [Phoenicibacter congonensis]|nr:site-2 protease family protein [Phoenicibacter congonensis]
MNLQLIASYVCIILAFVPAIVFHEVAHGFMAWKLGDPTAKAMGRLSVNPLKHIDTFGTVILPLFLMVMNLPVFGYAKPVLYNPLYFKDKRKGDFFVGIAGPLANFVMAFIGALVMNLLWPLASTFFASDIGVYFYFVFLPEFILINLYLMFFNLIPIP